MRLMDVIRTTNCIPYTIRAGPFLSYFLLSFMTMKETKNSRNNNVRSNYRIHSLTRVTHSVWENTQIVFLVLLNDTQNEPWHNDSLHLCSVYLSLPQWII